jgi:prepilin-type N-terminal cleavage/methylation domain-containing protein
MTARVILYRRRSSRKSGFTLIEMMVTLVVFLLLCAGLFALMSSMLQGTSVLQDESDRRDTASALNAYIKTQLATMTAHSTLFSYLRGDGEGLNQNGIIFGTAATATVFDSKVQPNGLYTLRVANYAVDPSALTTQDARNVLVQLASTDDPSVNWTKLMTDLKTIDWKFQDPNITDWLEQWTESGNPNLVEFSMQVGGDDQPTTMDYWIPQLTAINLRIAPAVSTGSTTPKTPTKPSGPTNPTNPTNPGGPGTRPPVVLP